MSVFIKETCSTEPRAPRQQRQPTDGAYQLIPTTAAAAPFGTFPPTRHVQLLCIGSGLRELSAQTN